MAALKGSKTEENLKAAFAGESQANRRYLYFAQKADVEGYNDVAAVFRSTAEGETGHAHGHLEFLEEVGDPATGKPIGGTGDNLRPRSPARPTNTPTCIRAWHAPPATRALTRSPTGSRRWRRPRSRMPAVSSGPSTACKKPRRRLSRGLDRRYQQRAGVAARAVAPLPVTSARIVARRRPHA